MGVSDMPPSYGWGVQGAQNFLGSSACTHTVWEKKQ